MEEFDEGKYFEAYKRVRNKFRNYDSLLLIASCLEYLHKPTKNNLEQLQKQPWLVLLLIKWIVLDEQSFSPGKKRPTIIDLNAILRSVHDLGSSIRLPTQFDHHRLFFRSIAFQQFIYQRNFSLGQLSRQIALFSKLPNNHLIKVQFKLVTGMEINRFLELSLALLTRFVDQENRFISAGWFASLGNEYSQHEIQHFLAAFSKSIEEIRQVLKERDGKQRLASEYYEQTPFIEFPLIRTGSEFVCIDPTILFRCIEHFVYDKLRMWDSEKFMGKFGRIFETHIERAVQHTGLPYYNESDIQKIVCGTGNLIDFIVTDADANIFIDAKAVEMAYLGKVSHLADVVRGKTENSILKAIEQAHNVMARMNNMKVNNGHLQSRSKNYLIVVTYKELYVGNGRSFYEAIAKDKIDNIYAQYAGKQTIDLENMYFFSVEEFEIFAEAIHKKQIGLVEGIEKAKSDDSSPATMKFEFSQHIASWNFESEQPEYLHEIISEVYAKYKNILSPQAIA